MMRRPPVHGAGHTAYRADIDGLRSIAVLGVLLYHFGIAGFGGGFVGVDIFFVISGFLIGRSIIADMHSRRYSLISFYERRLRRLFPAFFVVALVSVPLFAWLLLPPDLRSFGRSLVAAVFYVSNIAFYKESGYFDTGAINKPLLHTWSLSVEEQFYLVFPLLVWLAMRLRPRALPWVSAAVVILSLAVAQFALKRDASAVFYLFPYRAWELMLGVCLTLFVDRYAATLRFRAPLAMLGLALCLVPLFLYDHGTPFPGLAAAPPCIGAALLILTGSQGDSLANRLLATPLPRCIGLISYSLYLWHWPVFVALNYSFGGDLPSGLAVGGVLLSILLATLSWRFVEQPVRRKDFLGRGSLFAGVALLSGVLAAAGFALYRTDGLPGRFAGPNAALVKAADDFLQYGGTCVEKDNPALPGLAHCRLGAANAAPTVLVWADSHGRAYRDGIDAIAKEMGKSVLLVWAGGCPPLQDVGKDELVSSEAVDAECRQQNDRLLRDLPRLSTIRTVILIGRWSYYTQGAGLGRDADNRIALSGPDGRTVSNRAAQQQLFVDGLVRTVRNLRASGRDVFVLEQTPEIPQSSARVIAQQVVSGHIGLEAARARYTIVPRHEVEARQAAAQQALGELEQAGAIRVLHTHRYFCTESRCSSWAGDAPALFDNNHVTVATSIRLREVFRPALAEAAPR